MCPASIANNPHFSKKTAPLFEIPARAGKDPWRAAVNGYFRIEKCSLGVLKWQNAEISPVRDVPSCVLGATR